VYVKGSRLVVSPSDLVAHLLCPHVTELSLEVARGERSRPDADGADVIYQAAFFDESADVPAWRGHADFLRRVETPSTLGPYPYEPYDTKLAHQLKPGAVL